MPDHRRSCDGTPSVESPWWRYRRLWEAVATSMNAVAAVDHIRAIWRPLEQQIGEQVSRLGTGASPNARRDLSEQACTAALRVLAELEDQHIGVAGSGTA